jgi:hypothetical protein
VPLDPPAADLPPVALAPPVAEMPPVRPAVAALPPEALERPPVVVPPPAVWPPLPPPPEPLVVPASVPEQQGITSPAISEKIPRYEPIELAEFTISLMTPDPSNWAHRILRPECVSFDGAGPQGPFSGCYDGTRDVGFSINPHPRLPRKA